jgi:hypothetical protein
MLLFKGTSGLNTETDPARITFDSNSGIQDLAACKNIDIDDSGRISRRKGFEKKVTGSYHSAFSCGNYALCVVGDALTVLESDYSTTPIRVVTIGLRVNYTKVGNEIYYCNGKESGYVRDRISYPWTATSYTSTVSTRNFSDPPVGHLIGFYNGRIYIAVAEALFFSEANSRNHFDLARNVILESSRIRMFAPVVDGFYLGTTSEIIFYSGSTPNEFTRRVVANYPVIEGSDTEVMMSQIGEAEEGGKAILMATERGLAAAFKGGNFVNFSEDKVRYPAANFGAGIFKNRKYIVTLQP